MKQYNLIYIDPPWQFRDKCNAGKRGACHRFMWQPIIEGKASGRDVRTAGGKGDA